MLFHKSLTPHEREWQALLKKEARLSQKRQEEEQSALDQKLSAIVPDRLEDTLTLAFQKAVSLVFSKGKIIIEKTYSKEQWANEFEEQVSDHALRQDRKSLRAFSKKARFQSAQHVLLAGIEGSALGLLGIGLPDIPLFSAVLLRSLYQIAMSYGYPYDTPEERLFILMVMEVSLLRGDAFSARDQELNAWIATGVPPTLSQKEQMKQTSAALSSHLLYLKFLQGIPIIGLFGGFYDSLCLKRVTDYAQLKYKRRFLQQVKTPSFLRKLD